VGAADFRFYHSKLYWAQFQAAHSWTDSAATRKTGSILQGDWDRTGRAWGFHYTLRSLDPGFKAAAGFVNRTGIIDARAFNRLSFYGAPGAFVQTYGTFVGLTQIWNNDRGHHGVEEGTASITPSATLRGGWLVSGAVTDGYFAFDPAQYSNLNVQTIVNTPGGSVVDTVPFVVPAPARGQLGGSLSLTTPTFRHLTGSAAVTRGEVPVFSEASAGESLRMDASLDVRPTNAIRSSLQFSRLVIDRKQDGSRFSSETIPRLKVEYQISPPIFLRFVGQYAARSRSSLRDLNGNPILVGGVLDTGAVSNQFSTDWLFSYRPVPGTLVYFGYGSTLEDANAFRFEDMQRTRDGFFGKISYLFRF
jgi:hypothetical protein